MTKGVVVGEPDTLILSQLIKLSEMEAVDILKTISTVEKGCVIFFQLMDDETKASFLEDGRYVVDAIENHELGCAYERLNTLVISFLKDSLKRAEEKAK